MNTTSENPRNRQDDVMVATLNGFIQAPSHKKPLAESVRNQSVDRNPCFGYGHVPGVNGILSQQLIA
jgi:hypothetical protein